MRLNVTLYVHCLSCCIMTFFVTIHFLEMEAVLCSKRRYQLAKLYYVITQISTYLIHIFGAIAQLGPLQPHSWSHIQWHTTVSRTPLDEWSTRCTDRYLTTLNINKRQIPMSPAGFEPAIPASQRPQLLILDRSATGIGTCLIQCAEKYRENFNFDFCWSRMTFVVTNW